ncbi:FabD/lysophospholipase-like protein [Aspergillus unguis]
MASHELNILSLDGGGVRALSTLHILKSIMESIDRENPPKPCDFFDLIGGSGSGGLLAIMLGRLKMDIDQCIIGYTRLCKHVFGKGKKRLSLTELTRSGKKPKHEAKRIEYALKSILKELGHEDRDILLQDVDLSCRVVAFATDASTHKLVPLSSYPSKYCPNELYKSTKTWEAGAASFANASLFDPVPLGSTPTRRRFTDATNQANNPIREVWIEAKNVWRLTTLESQLRCLVSIGTGLPSIKRARNSSGGVFGFNKTAEAAFIDPEVETNKFIQEHSELDDDGRLFRFDVPNGLAEIGLDAVGEIEVIVDATQDYLGKELVYKQVRRCGKALARTGDSEVYYR